MRKKHLYDGAGSGVHVSCESACDVFCEPYGGSDAVPDWTGGADCEYYGDCNLPGVSEIGQVEERNVGGVREDRMREEVVIGCD